MRNPQLTMAIMLLACCVGCKSAGPDQAAAEPDRGSLRDRWIEMYPSTHRAKHTWDLDRDPNLMRLEEEYADAVLVQPHAARQLNLMVIDEDGHPLNGVDAGMLEVWAPWVFAMEPTMTRQAFTINQTCTVKWKRSDSSIEIDLYKRGYRTIKIGFDDREDARIDHAHEMLAEGHVLPPALPNGPLRVVMPLAMIWQPHSELEPPYQQLEDGPRSRNGDSVHATPPEGRAIVSSSNPLHIPAPIRATYCLVNGKDQIVWFTQLDRGNLFGLQISTDGSQVISWHSSGGNNYPSADGPFEWRVYSTPQAAR